MCCELDPHKQIESVSRHHMFLENPQFAAVNSGSRPEGLCLQACITQPWTTITPNPMSDNTEPVDSSERQAPFSVMNIYNISEPCTPIPRP